MIDGRSGRSIDNMDSLQYRRATSSDKHDVLDINRNVYDGKDYLYSYYDDFINSSHVTPYVALLDGKIVRFVATCVVDGGHTVITRAARVREDVTGQGVFGNLNRHVLAASKQNIHAITCSNLNPGTKKESFQMSHRKILDKLMIEIQPCSISELSLSNSDAPLKIPTDEDLQICFSDNPIKHYLFPKERITVTWMPYRLQSENIPLLRIDGAKVCMYSDVSVDDMGSVSGLLSISTTYACMQRPYVTMLDIYGMDKTTLRNHIVSHIMYIKQYTKGVYLDMIIFVEPEFEAQKLNQVCHDIGLNCVMNNQMQMLYEKDLYKL